MTTDEKILKLLYLYWVEHLSFNEVASATGYAVSTVKVYRNKYANRLNEAKIAFSDSPPKTNRRKTSTISDSRINWGNVLITYEKTAQGRDSAERSQKCYFFKFYDSKNHPVFTKIGTTVKSALSRLKQEISYYQKRGIEIAKVKICGIIECGDIPAEGYESYLRACFIHDFPNTFHKNDRFFDIDIPTEFFFDCCDYYAKYASPYNTAD